MDFDFSPLDDDLVTPPTPTPAPTPPPAAPAEDPTPATDPDDLYADFPDPKSPTFDIELGELMWKNIDNPEWWGSGYPEDLDDEGEPMRNPDGFQLTYVEGDITSPGKVWYTWTWSDALSSEDAPQDPPDTPETGVDDHTECRDSWDGRGQWG